MPSLTIHNGDCIEVMKDISGGTIDLIICDLPYGCLATGNINKNLNRIENGVITGPKAETKNGLLQGCAWDVKIDLKKFWEQAKRVLKNDNSPVIHFCTTKFGAELISSCPDWFRYDLVWDKGRGVSFLSANKMPMRSHEMIYIFSKAGAYYNRVDISGNFKANCGDKGGKNCRQYGISKGPPRPDNTGKRCALSVIHNPTSTTKGGHPTEKPQELYRWLIERYCPPDGTVLDPTFGSGNSVRTAYDMGRNAIGIEKNKEFYEKMANTIE
jgi:site-specific DNA-methyltransferase (adenine-specific)